MTQEWAKATQGARRGGQRGPKEGPKGIQEAPWNDPRAPDSLQRATGTLPKRPRQGCLGAAPREPPKLLEKGVSKSGETDQKCWKGHRISAFHASSEKPPKRTLNHCETLPKWTPNASKTDPRSPRGLPKHLREAQARPERVHERPWPAQEGPAGRRPGRPGRPRGGQSRKPPWGRGPGERARPPPG